MFQDRYRKPGPLGPRARYGALQADRRRLYAIMGVDDGA